VATCGVAVGFGSAQATLSIRDSERDWIAFTFFGAMKLILSLPTRDSEDSKGRIRNPGNQCSDAEEHSCTHDPTNTHHRKTTFLSFNHYGPPLTVAQVAGTVNISLTMMAPSGISPAG